MDVPIESLFDKKVARTMITIVVVTMPDWSAWVLSFERSLRSRQQFAG